LAGLDDEQLRGHAFIGVQADILAQLEGLQLRVEHHVPVAVVDVKRLAEQFEDFPADHVFLQSEPLMHEVAPSCR